MDHITKQENEFRGTGFNGRDMRDHNIFDFYGKYFSAIQKKMFFF